MNKTLKTYPDGSEFTIVHVCAAVVGGFALMGVYFGAKAGTSKIVEVRARRKIEKNQNDI